MDMVTIRRRLKYQQYQY